MSDAPGVAVPPLFVHTYTRFCNINEFAQAAAGVFASAAWPTANKAFFFPIYLPFPYPVKRFVIANGAVASGNFDIGIYSLDGTKLQSTGSTAQAGTTTLQYVGGFDFILPPASYYVALSMNGTTGTALRSNSWLTGARIVGALEQTTAFALPATMASAVGLSVAYVPMFGFTQTASGF